MEMSRTHFYIFSNAYISQSLVYNKIKKANGKKSPIKFSQIIHHNVNKSLLMTHMFLPVPRTQLSQNLYTFMLRGMENIEGARNTKNAILALLFLSITHHTVDKCVCEKNVKNPNQTVVNITSFVRYMSISSWVLSMQ